MLIVCVPLPPRATSPKLILAGLAPSRDVTPFPSSDTVGGGLVTVPNGEELRTIETMPVEGPGVCGAYLIES